MDNVLILDYYSFLIIKNTGYNPFDRASNSRNSKIIYPKSYKDNKEKYIRSTI